jgi:hypothetical protein
MAQDKTNIDFKAFLSRLTDMMIDYTPDQLRNFHNIAKQRFPAAAPVIRAYIEWANPTAGEKREAESKSRKPETGSDTSHLYDMLRSKELFPQNSDLAQFASRVLPGMAKRRFDKTSRTTIAGQIIEYLETLNSGKRERLEQAMRQAMTTLKSGGKSEPRSFFSQWEKIIKGIEL